jgi:hypothetical protein
LIELIDWQIYRITVFDLLEDKSGPVYLSKLLKVPKDGVYGHDIQKVLKGFEKWREGKK